jgi:probable phosphoglycerate mutase
MSASGAAAQGGAAQGAAAEPRVVLVRHAETEWSRSGRHTGRTDIPLTDHGRAVARSLRPRLAHERFDAALTSPLRRARETSELCGFGERAQARAELLEWDYGDYEGLTSEQIHEQRPRWSLWRDGCPGGESPAQVGARADRVIAELRALPGRTIVFSHGHMLRVLGARWIELDPAGGARLGLATGALSALGYEHQLPILARWNLFAQL